MVQANPTAIKLLSEEDYLHDPLHDRVMKNVKPPLHRQLSSKRAFANGQCDSELIQNWIKEGGKLSKSCLMSLILWGKQ